MKLKDIFDPKARANWLRLWSNQLALLFGIIMVWIVENSALVLSWVNQLENPWKGILTFVVMAGVPILIRMLKQPGLADKGGS